MDPRAKMGLGRPKTQSAQNHFKTDVYIGLVVTNPMQLVLEKQDRGAIK
jgi:hypothetical protein